MNVRHREKWSRFVNDFNQANSIVDTIEAAGGARRAWVKPSVRRMIAGDAENGLTNTRSDSLTGFSKS
jgi:hypothetical protein